MDLKRKNRSFDKKPARGQEQHYCLAGINPRHRKDHLSLLPSGPDEVHDILLRGDQPE